MQFFRRVVVTCTSHIQATLTVAELKNTSLSMASVHVLSVFICCTVVCRVPSAIATPLIKLTIFVLFK
jgi:hypothetical protein